eukprot:768265-Hanusia_phi.AAC.2
MEKACESVTAGEEQRLLCRHLIVQLHVHLTGKLTGKISEPKSQKRSAGLRRVRGAGAVLKPVSAVPQMQWRLKRRTETQVLELWKRKSRGPVQPCDAAPGTAMGTKRKRSSTERLWRRQAIRMQSEQALLLAGVLSPANFAHRLSELSQHLRPRQNFHRREADINYDAVLDNLETTLQRQEEQKQKTCVGLLTAVQAEDLRRLHDDCVVAEGMKVKLTCVQRRSV